MATTVVYGDASDGVIRSGNDGVYANSQAGVGFNAGTGLFDYWVGQEFTGALYYIWEAFWAFDTSSIPDNAVISDAVISLYGKAGASVAGSSAWDHQLRLDDWGVSMTTADWVATGGLSALPLLAHLAQVSVSNAAHNAFVTDDLVANINKTGFTRMVHSSSRVAAGTTPTGSETQGWESADQSGTTNDPKMTVTYTLGSSFHKESLLLGWVG